MDECLFCKVAAGEVPVKKLYEDDQLVAFYDIAPQAPIHFLVVPKRHIPSAAALTEADGALLGQVCRHERQALSAGPPGGDAGNLPGRPGGAAGEFL